MGFLSFSKGLKGLKFRSVKGKRHALGGGEQGPTLLASPNGFPTSNPSVNYVKLGGKLLTMLYLNVFHR